MRIGDILTSAGRVSQGDINQVLAAEPDGKARLGAQLIRYGLVTPDEVALALANQHKVVPALVKDLVHHDPKALRCIDATAAAQYGLLPIAYSGPDTLLVCFRNPNHIELVSRLEEKLRLHITPCVASELTMKRYWEYYYLDPSDAAQSDPSAEAISAVDGASPFQLVDLDHVDVEKNVSVFFSTASNGRSALQQAVFAARQQEQADEAAPTSLFDTLDEIQGAPNRQAAIDLLLKYLGQRFAACVLFRVREDLAMGQQGFGGHLDDPETVLALMLPLKNGILGAAYSSGQSWHGDPAQLPTVAQDRFLTLFNLRSFPKDVLVQPLRVGKRVISLLYVHRADGKAISASLVNEMGKVALALELVFERLIRDAQKTRTQTENNSD